MERAPELEALTRALYEATSKGDLAFFERHVPRASDLVFVGTAPGEWWSDRGALLDALRGQMQAAGSAFSLTPGEDLRACRQGDVGWVADRPTMRFGDTAVACRHTSVLVREAGAWTFVQQHFSIGVPNEQAFGADAARRLEQFSIGGAPSPDAPGRARRP